MGFLWTFTWKLWLAVVLLLAFGSMVLSVLQVRIGLRDKYMRLLMFIFDWARQRHARHQLRRGSRPMPADASLIQPEAYQTLSEKCNQVGTKVSFEDILEDSFDMTRWGVEVIVTDEVTRSFNVEELTSWNLLTRTDRGHNFISWRLTLLWALGWAFRYLIMVPSRMLIILTGWAFALAALLVIGPIPDGRFKQVLVRHFNTGICRIFMRSVSLSVTYHDEANRAQDGGVCVANHTSFLDFLILGAQTQFALFGQAFDAGFPGFVQRSLARVAYCVWFERESASDRAAAKRAMTEHCAKGGPPILLFPEGVCVNNTKVMRFRKGCFELGAPVHPVAIKYDRRFGEPFWHQDTWYEHIQSLMSSWAIKADVYYLPVMRAEPGESPIEFARRVKEAIALKGGFIDVDWEGYVKFLPVREEKILQIKRLYSERLKQYHEDFEEYLSAEEE